MTDDPTTPFVTVVVPVLDEEDHLEDSLRSLVAQWPPERLEVLVLDGGSTDASVAVAERVRREHPHVAVVPNPDRRQTAACNLAAEIADDRSAILLRADAHAAYPPLFIRRCVTALVENDATSVVVPMRTVGSTRRQRGIAAAQNSLIGNGGAVHRAGARSGWVEHGHHAAFDRAFFRRIGGYDTSFVANEDVDHDLRARAAGGRIWMCAEAEITYFPRSTLHSLARQYFRYGAGRARTMRKHRYRPKARHVASAGILLATVGGTLLAASATPVAAVVPAGYLAACLGWGVGAAVLRRDPWIAFGGPAAIVMHHAWALGFLLALLGPTPAPAGGPALVPTPQQESL